VDEKRTRSRAPLVIRTLKTRVARIAIAAFLASALTPVPALAAILPPSVVAPGALLATADGTNLWSRNAQTQRRVASTIKMLNALVVRERASLDETVVVSAKAAAINDGDVGLVAGQRLSVRKLLEIMLVASGNDAAEALAIHVAGSEARYVALMNAKAKQLGLSRTLAVDPHGLSKREKSTPADLAVLGRCLLADPWLKRIVNMRSVVVPRPGGKRTVLRSTFHPIWGYTGLQGVKTGYTRAAGYCFVASAKRGDVELVGVVLGTRSNSDRFAQMRTLLDWGFAHTHVRELISRDATLAVSLTTTGLAQPIVARPAKTISKALLDGSGPVKRRVRVATDTPTPCLVGQNVGTLDLLLGSRVIATVPLLAAADGPLATTFPLAAYITR